MSDALSRNQPGEHPTKAASCIPHARRKFVDAASRFPDEVAHVLTELRKIFHVDRTTREEELSPEERLQRHQRDSAPVMEGLKEWMDQQLDDQLVEPNSALGEAIQYMRNHWDKLTLFLREAALP
jgi:transposase